jgi:hypothetical protein
MTKIQFDTAAESDVIIRYVHRAGAPSYAAELEGSPLAILAGIALILADVAEENNLSPEMVAEFVCGALKKEA